MYHYGGNNPIKYTDPTGDAIAVIPFIAPTVIAGAKAIGAWLASLFVVGVAATAVGVTLDAAIDDSKEAASLSPQEETSEDKSNDRLEQILDGAKPGRETKGRTKQWNKTGNIDNANDDFDSLKPQKVKDIPGGRTGELPDGRKINVRDHSSDGRPTLEIQDGKNQIKIRYGE